jgi:hypothetical protein
MAELWHRLPSQNRCRLGNIGVTDYHPFTGDIALFEKGCKDYLIVKLFLFEYHDLANKCYILLT